MPAPKARDPEATREVLETWLQGRMPEASRIALRSLGGPSATGFSNDTLLYDLSYELAGESLERGIVFRFEPSGLPVFPDYDLALQFRAMQGLGATGEVPVPRVDWLEEDASILGAPFYAMERVEGRIPTDTPPYHTGGWVAEELGPDEREALWCSALDALAAIHRRTAEDVGLASLHPSPPGCTPLQRQLAEYERFYRWALRGKPSPTIEDALAWLEERRPAPGEPERLCWGAARVGNMIFRGGRCVAVLDWEMVTRGNPEQDLAWFLFHDRHHSEGVGAERLPGFPGREESVARWSGATGLEAPHLDYYEVFAAMRFSVIMMRVAQGLQDSDILPTDSDFEIDNTASRLLAYLLELPPPSER